MKTIPEILDAAESRWRTFYDNRKPEPPKVYEPDGAAIAKVFDAMHRLNIQNGIYK